MYIYLYDIVMSEISLVIYDPIFLSLIKRRRNYLVFKFHCSSMNFPVIPIIV